MFINLKFMKTSITKFRSYEMNDFIMLFMIAAEGVVVACSHHSDITLSFISEFIH